ncbi:unnamed protein product [Schistosoma rodhaini]|nr:unnamed protein product [Schistosoma rodhaini]
MLSQALCLAFYSSILSSSFGLCTTFDSIISTVDLHRLNFLHCFSVTPNNLSSLSTDEHHVLNSEQLREKTSSIQVRSHEKWSSAVSRKYSLNTTENSSSTNQYD